MLVRYASGEWAWAIATSKRPLTTRKNMLIGLALSVERGSRSGEPKHNEGDQDDQDHNDGDSLPLVFATLPVIEFGHADLPLLFFLGRRTDRSQTARCLERLPAHRKSDRRDSAASPRQGVSGCPHEVPGLTTIRMAARPSGFLQWESPCTPLEQLQAESRSELGSLQETTTECRSTLPHFCGTGLWDSRSCASSSGSRPLVRLRPLRSARCHSVSFRSRLRLAFPLGDRTWSETPRQ
jgi:hypothetical protein